MAGLHQPCQYFFRFFQLVIHTILILFRIELYFHIRINSYLVNIIPVWCEIITDCQLHCGTI